MYIRSPYRFLSTLPVVLALLALSIVGVCGVAGFPALLPSGIALLAIGFGLTSYIRAWQVQQARILSDRRSRSPDMPPCTLACRIVRRVGDAVLHARGSVPEAGVTTTRIEKVHCPSWGTDLEVEVKESSRCTARCNARRVRHQVGVRLDQGSERRLISGLHALRVCAFIGVLATVMAGAMLALVPFGLGTASLPSMLGLSAPTTVAILVLALLVPPAGLTMYFNSASGDLPMSWPRVMVTSFVQAAILAAVVGTSLHHPTVGFALTVIASILVFVEGQSIFNPRQGDWF